METEKQDPGQRLEVHWFITRQSKLEIPDRSLKRFHKMDVPQSLPQEVPLSPRADNAVNERSKPVAELTIYYAMLLIVFAAILVPIWVVDYPGMLDYPNHLVRCYILAHYHDNPVFQQRFELDHSPLPNLAIDLIVTPLLRILPLLVAGKVFLSIAAALYVMGCSAVGRAVAGKPNWLALVCAFTFYNSQLLWGFVNYMFGVGVFLCAFAFWLRVRNTISPLRFFLLCLLSLVAFLAHLSSVLFLGISCSTIALLDFLHDRKIRNLIVKLAWLACPLVLMEGFVKRNSGGRGVIDWGPPIQKLTNLLSPVRSYSVTLDVGIICVLLLCAWAMLKGCKVHSVAVASLVLFALFLITPQVLFNLYPADVRYVIPAYTLLILSIEPRWGRWQKAALAVALAAMVVHTGSITTNWLTVSHRSEQVLAMGEVLPAGARIDALPNFDTAPKLDRSFFHVIEFWTITHDADISSFFSSRGQQLLVRRQPLCNDSEGAKCFASFDYIWTYDPPVSLRQDIVRLATPVAVWEEVTLWRVNRPVVPLEDPSGKTSSHF
jgi:hypothetical protein